jgi:hypothetical protein
MGITQKTPIFIRVIGNYWAIQAHISEMERKGAGRARRRGGTFLKFKLN